ncbi:MAG: hypothetical protein ACLQSR_06610 [Limisphaerales bacterium]
MDTEEREIFQFLKSWGTDYTNAMEVCRRAGSKKKFYEDPSWAKPILMRMEERGILESDLSGRYRIKPVKKKRGTKWVAPDIAKILKESGLEMDAVETAEGEIADDEYYEEL